jgi:hypothetical protein
LSLTRRELMHVAVAATGASPFLTSPTQAAPARHREGVRLYVSDDNCLALESAAGYRGGLHGIAAAPAIIVPAISELSLVAAMTLRAKAEAGDSVILESALTFIDSRAAERQCRIIRDVFGLPIECPAQPPEYATSYLQYRWPMNALVRCFGAPVYLRKGDYQPIAHHFGSRVVAARTSMGRGQIAFFGAPLGPLLLSEDQEATLLVRRMITEPIYS